MATPFDAVPEDAVGSPRGLEPDVRADVGEREADALAAEVRAGPRILGEFRIDPVRRQPIVEKPDVRALAVREARADAPDHHPGIAGGAAGDSRVEAGLQAGQLVDVRGLRLARARAAEHDDLR